MIASTKIFVNIVQIFSQFIIHVISLFFPSIRHAKTYLFNCSNRTGIAYKKAVYKQYTDNTFTSEKPKSQWLGFLGPVIRAEVGDDIVVHLKNFASRPYSIHPHGVFYKKASEGGMGFIQYCIYYIIFQVNIL